MQLDFDELQKDLAELTEAVGENLLQKPPRWLKKKQLQAIFARGSLSVAIVSDSMIRKVNKEWRQIDKATDVLSFPLELDEPAFFIDEDEEFAWMVGDIIISAEKAKKQAEEYGHSLKRELAFLFVHGCLHVLGFDHITKDEEKEMFGRQTAILRSRGFKRDA